MQYLDPHPERVISCSSNHNPDDKACKMLIPRVKVGKLSVRDFRPK